MTLWLNQSQIRMFFTAYTTNDVDITTTQIEAPDGELAFKVTGLDKTDLLETGIDELHSFVHDIDGRYFFDIDDTGTLALYVCGPESASGGTHEPLQNE